MGAQTAQQGSPVDASQDAWQVAGAAAAAAGVQLHEPSGPPALAAVSAVFDEVWGREPSVGAVLAPEALIALVHAGAQVTAAVDADDTVVGATAAFLGRDDDGSPFLHSHVTAVRDDLAGRGVGRALKWRQRAWCLERGIGRVRWTFDPLVRRNAVLNLVVLGARVATYEQDVYGRMQDRRNAGGTTDRLVVDWWLTEPRVRAAAGGRAATPDVTALQRAGAEVVLAVGDDGGPAVHPTAATTGATGAPRRLLQVPPDIEHLRATSPDLAGAWAQAVRTALGGALADGLRVTGCTRDGWYALAAERDVADLADHR